MAAKVRYEVLVLFGRLLWRSWRYALHPDVLKKRFVQDLIGGLLILGVVGLGPLTYVENWFWELESPWQWTVCGAVWVLLAIAGWEVLLKAWFYLDRQIAYEGLRTPSPPTVSGFTVAALRMPLVTVILFVTGISLGIWLLGATTGWMPEGKLGTCLRRGCWVLVSVVPPLAELIRYLVEREPEVPWPPWLDWLLVTSVFGLIIWLLRAWVNLQVQRLDVCKGLIKPRTAKTPYGFREGTHNHNAFVPEPHEQVLLMQAERIGPKCLVYLSVELQGIPPELPGDGQSDAWGGLAAVEKIFQTHGKRCWTECLHSAGIILNWTFEHLGALIKDFQETAEHRLAQAVVAAAQVLSEVERLPSAVVSLDGVSQLLKGFRSYLQTLFPNSRNYPPVFLACCRAAELLGKEEDIQLLDQQVRRIDVSRGFSVEQTDHILETRDRLWARSQASEHHRAKILRRLSQLGLQVEQQQPLVVRRPKDGARMVLIEGSSFVRGDPGKRETRPARRIYLSDYLIDLEPVQANMFHRFVEEEGSVMGMDRGFFPMQNPNRPARTGPALYVTWFAAEAYARWAVPGGHLPTEAQWEKAARGPHDARRYPMGKEWHEPVLSPYGIRIGDLLEWCRDAYDPDAYSKNPNLFDPIMEASEDEAEVQRVIRGKRPGTSATEYSISERIGGDPLEDGLLLPVGFRVVLEIPAEISRI